MKKRAIITVFAAIVSAAMMSCHTLSTARSINGIEAAGTVSEWTDELVQGKVKSAKLAGGLTAMVYNEGRIEFAGGYGLAGEYDQISGQTPMPIGSISKIFTAIAVMQLVEAGTIDLDTPAGVYLPKLRLAGNGHMVFSVRDLLTHHSGVPGDLFQDWMMAEAGTAPMRNLYAELDGRPLAAEPGRLFSYANIGYTLLGLIVEEQSGMNYEEYIRSRIFEPAGMKNSLVYPGEIDATLPDGFTKDGTISVPGIRDVPAGNLLISADDMGAFVHALFEGTIISSDTFSQMTTVQNAGNKIDREFSIGLGFWLIDPMNSGELIAAHGGELPPAFYSVLVTLPQRKMAVFVSINDERGGGTLHVDTALEIVNELLVRDGGEKPTPVERGDFLPVAKPDRELFAGLYGTVAGIVEITPKGDAFQVSVAGNSLYMAPREYGRYGVQMRLFNLIPLPIKSLEAMEFDMFEADGDVWVGIWMGGIYMGAFSKLEEVEYPEAYAHYVGNYDIDGGGYSMENGVEAISHIEIRKIGDRYALVFSLLSQKIEIVIRPDGPGRALTDGTGRGMGDLLVFEEAGKGVVLHWSGMRLVRSL